MSTAISLSLVVLEELLLYTHWCIVCQFYIKTQLSNCRFPDVVWKAIPCHKSLNVVIRFICLSRKELLLHIRTARQKSGLIQAVLLDHGSKLLCWPVCVGLWKKSMPDCEISKSKKWTLPFSNLFAVKLRFLSKLLNFFKITGMLCGLINTKVSST